ncbi:unnamed protein product [Paramecium octaurelia]|uniref:Uncharacterized protein n=1 Tax=Paramecium octaurelia TaxID=43137 RepID=A0A8S1S6G0_PAROT|nr:unnamed protein product [Paramecium octaurelia]
MNLYIRKLTKQKSIFLIIQTPLITFQVISTLLSGKLSKYLITHLQPMKERMKMESFCVLKLLYLKACQRCMMKELEMYDIQNIHTFQWNFQTLNHIDDIRLFRRIIRDVYERGRIQKASYFNIVNLLNVLLRISFNHL